MLVLPLMAKRFNTQKKNNETKTDYKNVTFKLAMKTEISLHALPRSDIFPPLFCVPRGSRNAPPNQHRVPTAQYANNALTLGIGKGERGANWRRVRLGICIWNTIGKRWFNGVVQIMTSLSGLTWAMSRKVHCNWRPPGETQHIIMNGKFNLLVSLGRQKRYMLFQLCNHYYINKCNSSL